MTHANVLWKLPVPSTEIETGPDVLLSPGKLTIRFGDEDGNIFELRFSEIVRFVFTELYACSADYVHSYDALLDFGSTSAFARDILVCAKRDMSHLRHFRLFLDDVGGYDVFAREVQW